MRLLKNKSGVALLAVIFLLVVMAFVGVIFISLSSSNTTQSVNEVYSSRALYVAEGGLERAGRYLLKREGSPSCTTCTCLSINGNALFTNTSLGNGQFTVTSSLNSTFTTLSALTNNTSTTIPAASVAGYAPFGRIMIDREMMDYTSIGVTFPTCTPAAPPCFIGVARGADGTTATIHNPGTRISQVQCLLSSTGGVPTIGAGTNQRVASLVDVVQDGWVVGAIAGGRPTMFRWNGTNWTNLTAMAPPVGNLASVNMLSPADGWAVSNGNNVIRWNGTNWATVAVAPVQLNSVFMNSSSDGWVVGNPGFLAAQRPFFFRWNGLAWSIFNSGLNINRTLRSVYCVSTNDCWAVGNPGGGGAQQPLILHWNGVGWSLRKIGLPNIGQILRSITCTTTNDCWAVGNPGGGGAQQPLILHWNGAAWSTRNNGVAGTNRILQSVHCISANDCWAVGNTGGVVALRPFILHWNGAGWSINNAGVTGTNQTLNSVNCITTNDCWAAGNNGTLIHWNGATWATEAIGVATQLNSTLIIGPKKPSIAWREVVQ